MEYEGARDISHSGGETGRLGVGIVQAFGGRISQFREEFSQQQRKNSGWCD